MIKEVRKVNKCVDPEAKGGVFCQTSLSMLSGKGTPMLSLQGKCSCRMYKVFDQFEYKVFNVDPKAMLMKELGLT